MREITDEYILSLIDKYRDYLKADLEKCLCLDCYNLVKGLNMTENDIKLQNSVCKMCSKHKPCVIKNDNTIN